MYPIYTTDGDDDDDMPFAWAQTDPNSVHGGHGDGGGGSLIDMISHTTLPYASTSIHPSIDTTTTSTTTKTTVTAGMEVTAGVINTTGGTGGSRGDPQSTIPRDKVDVGGTHHPINLSNAPPLLSFPDSPWCGSAGKYHPSSHIILLSYHLSTHIILLSSILIEPSLSYCNYNRIESNRIESNLTLSSLIESLSKP